MIDSTEGTIYYNLEYFNFHDLVLETANIFKSVLKVLYILIIII